MRGLPSDSSAAAEVADGTLPLASSNRVRLMLPAAPLESNPPLDKVLMALTEGVSIGYESGSTLIQDVEVSFKIGSRTALLGPNGCGKTTLLKTLAGSLPVKEGYRRVGAGNLRRARVQLFTQDLAQDLPSDATPIEYILKDCPAGVEMETARRALGSLGLRPDAHNSKIGNLSGGEKARVALAVFVTRPADVLLLDEPTNHLDGAAVTALSAGLQAHEGGAVIVASHDRAFVEALKTTQTITVIRDEDGGASALQVTHGKPNKKSFAAAPARASIDSSTPE